MTRTWRSTIPVELYESLLDTYGATEMRRQEVIWELCETELSFVDSIRAVIDLFARPLQSARGKWIKGVPTPVSRLLDWATDIVSVRFDRAQDRSLLRLINGYSSSYTLNCPMLCSMSGGQRRETIRLCFGWQQH